MDWTWKKIWSTFRNKNPVNIKKESKKDTWQKKMPWNIYDPGMSFSEHAKKFHIIHFFFKYKFFQPLIMIGNKILGKHLIKEAPKNWYDKNLQIFDKAFDEAQRKWYSMFILNVDKGISGMEWKDPITLSEKIKRSSSCRVLTMLKELVMTLTVYDTAYRPFFDMLMFEIADGMGKGYPKGKVRHCIYSNMHAFDAFYYQFGSMLVNDMDVTEVDVWAVNDKEIKDVKLLLDKYANRIRRKDLTHLKLYLKPLDKSDDDKEMDRAFEDIDDDFSKSIVRNYVRNIRSRDEALIKMHEEFRRKKDLEVKLLRGEIADLKEKVDKTSKND